MIYHKICDVVFSIDKNIYHKIYLEFLVSLSLEFEYGNMYVR